MTTSSSGRCAARDSSTRLRRESRELRPCRSGVRFTPGALRGTGMLGWSGYLGLCVFLVAAGVVGAADVRRGSAPCIWKVSVNT
jgi:hypothetical protein